MRRELRLIAFGKIGLLETVVQANWGEIEFEFGDKFVELWKGTVLIHSSIIMMKLTYYSLIPSFQIRLPSKIVG
jgi:hypothetical protein